LNSSGVSSTAGAAAPGLVRRRLNGGGAARHRRDDADRVAGLERRGLFLQIADVFVVDVHVDEAAQLSFAGVQMRAQVAELRREIRERLADGRAGHLHGVRLAGVGAQRGGDQNRGHAKNSSSKADRSGSSRHDRRSPDAPPATATIT
jgi:hypothetical protein